MWNVPHPKAVVATTLALVFAGVIVGSGCGLDELLNPCGIFGKTDSAGNTNGKSDFMDGSWDLTTVDGKSLPFTLPAGAGRLTSGSIDFNTFNLDEGSCQKPKKSKGQIIALYHVIPASGVDKPQAQIGSFEFDNESKAVTLRALGYAIASTATLQGIYGDMDIVAPIPIPFVGEITYRLHFTRFAVPTP